MPDRKTHFSEAENNKYNVSNVLNVMSDGSSLRPKQSETKKPEQDASYVEINVEEGAPFTDGIDPQATIGEYMKLHEEEEALMAEQENTDSGIIINEEPEPLQEGAENVIKKDSTLENHEATQEKAPDDEERYTLDLPESQVKSPIIREQAQKARDPFIDDLRSLDSEPAIQRMKAREETTENSETVEASSQTEAPSPTRRIRKPRFVKPAPAPEEPEEEISTPTEDIPQTEETVEEASPIGEEIYSDEQEIVEEDDQVEEDDAQTYDFEDAYAEAVAAQRNSICEDLHELQQHLTEARSPMLHKGEVLVPREKTLRLIRSLTAICDVNPAYIDGASEDMLIDHLTCDHSEGDYEPLKRARCRAQTIIQNATKQAETIITDAKVLATQLLAETEAEIKEKYDDADMQIAVRMDTAKEESSKKLNEARSELTASRQHSVEILSKYLEKAEIDYQGYWERAENTVMASLEQSESILLKAAEIYRKELEVIRQDRDELNEILEHLKRYKRL